MSKCKSDKKFAKSGWCLPRSRATNHSGWIVAKDIWPSVRSSDQWASPSQSTIDASPHLATDEVAYLLQEILRAGGDSALAELARMVQALALRISAKVNAPLTPAAFLIDDRTIEFVLASTKNSRSVYLDASLDREEVWAHLVATNEEPSTMVLDERQSVASVAQWLGC